MRILPFLATLLPNLRRWESSVSYNDGQWTPTPTSSYWYGYSTYYTYSTTTNCITYGPTEIVTITSIIPCPVTIYTTTYECEDCCETCQLSLPCDNCDDPTTYTTDYDPTPGITTPDPPTTTNDEVETLYSYTSNGYVVVVVTTLYSATAGATPAQSNVQVIYASEGRRTRMWEGLGGGSKSVLFSIFCALATGLLAVVL